MKILFASMPFDGHFNPLTGLATHLREQGHDVRFYTGPTYAERLAKLGVPHIPFRRARDVNSENLVQHFPEYERLGAGPKALEFALNRIFFGNTEAHFHDIREARETFEFEAFVCDGALYAAYLVRKKLNVPVYIIGPSPTPAPTSKTAPPPFFGLRPARTIFGRIQHRIVRAMVESTTKSGMKSFNELLAREGLPSFERSVFDLPCAAATVYFQSGVPSMDFPRDDWPENFRFAGALLPAKRPRTAQSRPYAGKLARYGSLVVVSQGTIDNRDPEKLIVPTIEALKNGPHLVVACTGHRNTAALRERFPHDNVVIEDYVDFDVLLEDANVFVCNGGYGGVTLALSKGVPILAAGKLEGKHDITARIDYCGLGIDLGTERPSAKKIRAGVERLLAEKRFAQNAVRVKGDIESYDPIGTISAAIVGGPSARAPRRESATASG